MSRVLLARDTESTSATRAASLPVNEPGDPYELEAERNAAIAARGGRVPQATHPPQGLARKILLGRRHPINPAKPVQPKPTEPLLQRKPDTTPAPTRPTPAATPQGGGRPLDPATRTYMESRLGSSFSHVRIHTDAHAAASARSLHAQAYTLGSDITFGPGRYAPHTTSGRHLLAHELTHVVQQTGSATPAAPRRIQRLPDARGWLLGKLKGLKGYSLFCVVIGKDLVTGEKVDTNPTNLTQGVLKLFDGGEAIFERLKKAGDALNTAYQWLLGEVEQRGLTEKYFFDLIDRAVATVDLFHLIDSEQRVETILKEPFEKLVSLAKVVGAKVLDILLEAGFQVFPAGKKVYGILKKAGSAITRIAKDPISFGKNLFGAVQQGFKNFGTNILEHLGDGLKTWIFEEINLPGLHIPAKFDFASIVKLVLQVLGLTYEQRRPQLVQKLGEPAVYYFETAGKILLRIHKEGFGAIWEMIQEKASNLFDSVFDSAKDWVIKQIVKLGLAHVVALSSPVGEVLEVLKSIYETINFFIEKATKFVELVDSVVDSLTNIVEGNIAGAAKKIEDTMARSIPLILRFLADQIGLSGIGKSIREIIQNVRKPIDEAIGKVLGFIVEKAKPAWESVKATFTAGLDAVKQWWLKPRKFKYGEEDHSISLEGSGEHPEVLVSSNPPRSPIISFLKDVHATPAQTNAILAIAKKLGWRQGDLQKPADDEKDSKDFDKLAELMGSLKAREAPKSKIQYPTAPHALGGGQEADAFLSSDHEIGTEPNDTDPPIWNDLGYLRGNKEKFYIRGHLLSMRLGGQGLWRNMMPITNTINQRMNSQVESKLNKAIATGKRFYHYNVKAQYANDVLPDPTPTDTPDIIKTRALTAEKRLVSLSWTVRAAAFDKDAGGWKETPDPLLDQDGKPMDSRVAQGDFTPPTVR
jgi:hypothetical protein